MSPTPANRTRRPSVPTAAPLIPWPQIRTIPDGRVAPARRAANVSLRTSVSAAPPTGAKARLEDADVARIVRPGEAEHRDPRWAARVAAGLRGEPGETLCRDLEGRRLVRDRRAADRPDQRAVGGDEGDVGLGVAAVDCEDRRDRHLAKRSSSSIRTNVAPRSRSPSMIAGRASSVPGGQAWKRTTAPSPMGRRVAQGVLGEERTGPRRLPVLEDDIGRRCRGSRAAARMARTRGSSAPAMNGQRNHGRGSTPVASPDRAPRRP